MGSVFIGFARPDKRKAEFIARILGNFGWSVWWDQEIPPGKTWPSVIEGALTEADCIVVLWSKKSVTSRWVQKEARFGADRGNLVPVLLESVTVPFEFDDFQAAYLVDWDGSRDHEGIVALVSSISEFSPRSAGEVRGRDQTTKLLRILHEVKSVFDRVEAGNMLAKRGDPRFSADTWFLPTEPLLGFVEVPAGQFMMGSDENVDAEADQHDHPQNQISVDRFFMGRFPVTANQYNAFLQDNGFDNNHIRVQLRKPNRPVYNLSWQDALEYCDWLTRVLREWDGTPDELRYLLKALEWRVTLPSEAEWEKSARGTDGRIFPWGNEPPDPELSNYHETELQGPSSVGCFPSGVSPFGIHDMSGNVWEWTRSTWVGYEQSKKDGKKQRGEEIPTGRVFRGGSWDNHRWEIRCASRRWMPKDLKHGLVGFRVALCGPDECNEGSQDGIES